MKLSIRVLFAALSIFAFSCSDDDETSRANEVVIDGSSSKIAQAYQGYYTIGESTVFYLYFSETGVELEEYEDYDDFIGTGKLLYITISVPGNLSTLPAGTYSEIWGTYYDLVDGDWNYADEFSIDNNVVVTKSGDQYTITFKGTGEEGETPATYDVHYSGGLQNIRLAL